MSVPSIPSPPPPPPPPPPPGRASGSARLRPPLAPQVGTVLTLLAAAAQVLAAFHHWYPDGSGVAVDVSLLAARPSPVNVGTVLLLLAALPAVAALATPSGWPRAVSAVVTAVLVLAWVLLGPVGPVATGVWLAAGAVCGHLVAAALAR